MAKGGGQWTAGGGRVSPPKGKARWSLRHLGRDKRQYLRDYLRWLRPHGRAVGVVFVLALVVAGLEMIEPLFTRFIIDHVLLNRTLDAVARLSRLNVVGAAFLAVILV